MKLILSPIIAVYMLSSISAASAHAFNSCWRLAGSTTNQQVCLDVDIPDNVASVCSKLCSIY